LCGKLKEAEEAVTKALKINLDVHGELNPAVASCYEVLLEFICWFKLIKLVYLIVVGIDTQRHEE
jgi:hypothetical protein